MKIDEDYASQLEEMDRFIQEIQKQKQVMQVELETAGDYLLDSEDKVNKANNMALDLLNKLKEADEEIEALKNYIMFLKSKTKRVAS